MVTRHAPLSAQPSASRFVPVTRRGAFRSLARHVQPAALLYAFAAAAERARDTRAARLLRALRQPAARRPPADRFVTIPAGRTQARSTRATRTVVTRRARRSALLFRARLVFRRIIGGFFVSGLVSGFGRGVRAGRAAAARAEAEQTCTADNPNSRQIFQESSHALHVYVPAYAGYKRFRGSRVSPRRAPARSAQQPA
jgi:hypothetical protein